jgi:hypothetical protein
MKIGNAQGQERSALSRHDDKPRGMERPDGACKRHSRGTLARCIEIELGDIREARDIRQKEPAVLPLHESATFQRFQSLVGVDEGEADCIGEVLLSEGKSDASFGHKPDIVGPNVKVQ